MLETIFIIFFTIAFVALTWWRGSFAIYFCLATLPLYLWRFQIGRLPMTALEVMILAIFAVWAIKLLLAPGNLGNKVRKAFWPWRWLILAFIVCGTLAMFISPDLPAAAGLWKAYIIEPLLFFLVFVNTIKTKSQINKTLLALGLGVIAIAGYAIIQYLGLAPIPTPYGLEDPRRVTSFFPFPTAIGKLLAPLTALFFALFLTRFSLKNFSGFLKNNWYWIVAAVAGLAAIALSVTEGALLGVFVALIFIGFFLKPRRWLWLLLAGIIVVALALPATRTEISQNLTGQSVSTDVRVVMWRGASRIVRDHPIIGTGLASFPIVYDQYKEAAHTEYFPNPDSFLLSIWIEMGLAGVIIFIWVIVRFFRESTIALKKYRPLAIGLMAGMIALLVHGLVDTPYFKNDLAIMFWTLIALVVITNKYLSSDKNR